MPYCIYVTTIQSFFLLFFKI